MEPTTLCGKAMNESTRNKKGFTLVELLIVVIIIAVLAAIAIQHFTNTSQRSREAALRAELKNLRNVVEVFKADMGCYPASFDAFTAVNPPATCISVGGSSTTLPSVPWRGPYISNVGPNPVDGAQPGYTYTSTAGGSLPLGTVTADAGAALDGTDYSHW